MAGNGAESESVFGLLDDYTFALVVEHFAHSAAMREWASLCRVCRRWRNVATPVLRRAQRLLWARFVAPQERFQGDVIKLSLDGTTATSTATARPTNAQPSPVYAWALTPLLPVASFGPNGIGARFAPSQHSCVYVAVFVVARGGALPPCRELHWTPHNTQLHLPEGVSACSLGCYSGTVFKHYDGKQADQLRRSTLDGRGGDTYDILFNPTDFSVEFLYNGRNHASCPFFPNKDKTLDALSAAKNLSICFGVGFNGQDIKCTIRRLLDSV